MKKNDKWPAKMPQKYSKVIKSKLSHLIKNARKSINCEKETCFWKINKFGKLDEWLFNKIVKRALKMSKIW